MQDQARPAAGYDGSHDAPRRVGPPLWAVVHSLGLAMQRSATTWWLAPLAPVPLPSRRRPR
jgi:hypothetical protein